jgi:hypothetical protein
MGREEEIKLIAYKIWEEERCVDGHDCEHWFRAEAIWEQQQKQKVGKQSTKAKAIKKKSPKT